MTQSVLFGRFVATLRRLYNQINLFLNPCPPPGQQRRPAWIERLFLS